MRDTLNVGAGDHPQRSCDARWDRRSPERRGLRATGGPRVRLGSEFVGLTSASGPPGARLRIGIWSFAQYEENGPITATISRV